MTQLTLGNELTGTVSREVNEASRRASGLGESLATGNDKFVEVVDGFLGHSLRDSEIVLVAIAKNTAYSINMLTITEEYLKTVASSLQEGLKTIGSAGPISADKLAVLQKNLDDKKAQVTLLVRTANFDGKSLLSGGASKVNVQVGLSIADKLTIRVSDISIPKLFRTGAANAVNNWIAADINRTTAYNNQTTFNDAIIDKHNFTQDAALTNAELSAAIVATRTGNPSFARLESQGATLTPLLNAQLRVAFVASYTAEINALGGAAAANGADAAAANAADANLAAGGTFETALAAAAAAGEALSAGAGALITGNGLARGITLMTADQADLVTALGIAPAKAELLARFADNQPTDLTNEVGLALAQDVFTAALNVIRAEQATVANQQQNVIEAADALRATTNVTQKSADSYLKTDYVMTAQQYSETIRTMVAAITSLQAANKIPEAAQRLIDALAR